MTLLESCTPWGLEARRRWRRDAEPIQSVAHVFDLEPQVLRQPLRNPPSFDAGSRIPTHFSRLIASAKMRWRSPRMWLSDFAA
jgi:hypothetical protein